MTTLNKHKQFSQIPCVICGASSSGYHFGVVSCESCKVFFCRSLKRPCLDEQSKAPYLHRCNGPTAISSANCQRCRFDDCIKAGMSASSVCIGRHSAERRLQKAMTLTKLAEKNQLLQDYTSRRRTISATATRIPANMTKKIPSPEDSSLGECSKTNDETTCVEKLPEQPPHQQQSIEATPPLVNDCNMLTMSPIDISSVTAEQLIQQVVSSIGLLNDIRTVPYIPVASPDMTTEAISASMMNGFQTYEDIVRKYVRSLPGFTNVTSISDRIRLFNGSCHPLYSTHLSLDYDTVNQIPKFFSIEPGISQRVVLQRFPDLMDVLHQFADSGVAITSAQFTRVEFALLCALIFFNPNPQPHVEPTKNGTFGDEVQTTTSLPLSNQDGQLTIGEKYLSSRLQDSKKVQMISTRYWQAVERFVRSTFPPETASARLAVFSESLNYFRNTSALMHQTMVNIVDKNPWMVNQNRLFEETINKLWADNINPTKRATFGRGQIISQFGVVKFEPTF